MIRSEIEDHFFHGRSCGIRWDFLSVIKLNDGHTLNNLLVLVFNYNVHKNKLTMDCFRAKKLQSQTRMFVNLDLSSSWEQGLNRIDSARSKSAVNKNDEWLWTHACDADTVSIKDFDPAESEKVRVTFGLMRCVWDPLLGGIRVPRRMCELREKKVICDTRPNNRLDNSIPRSSQVQLL